jgi:hypothetical protein
MIRRLAVAKITEYVRKIYKSTFLIRGSANILLRLK